MTELKEWYICKVFDEEEYILYGAVYGHSSPRLYDGLFIHTSPIKDICDKGDKLEFQTQNTLYALNKQSVSTKSLAPTMKKMTIFPSALPNLWVTQLERLHRNFTILLMPSSSD